MPGAGRFVLLALAGRRAPLVLSALALLAGCTDTTPRLRALPAMVAQGRPATADAGLLPREAADVAAVKPANPAGSAAVAANSGVADAAVPAELVDAGAPADAGQCPLLGAFVARTPTLYILADRSGTMFDPLPLDAQTTLWATLRVAILPLLEDFQSELRLGFAATSGDGSVCPELVDVPPALNNAAAIAASYTVLEQGPHVHGGLWLALDSIAARLRADPAAKESYILLLSDGDADFCIDGDRLCPMDAVIGAVQRLRAGLDSAGNAQLSIPTLVTGIASDLVVPNALERFASAGAGQPVLPLLENPDAPPNPNAISDQCSGVPAWLAALPASGQPVMRGQTIANYSDSAGSGAVLAPAEAPLRAALASLRSCVFDLEGQGQANLSLDLTSGAWLGAASVVLDAAPIPYDAANGWHLPTATTLELTGTACDAWRSSTDKALRIDLPCSAFVVP